MTDKLPLLSDDGLEIPDVGSWGEQKYRLVSNYATMFSTAMKEKWDWRIYIDLFAGAGRARIRNTNRIIPASPMLALNVPHRFNLYIFCEKKKKNIEALKERVSRDYAGVNSEFLLGDANQLVDQVLQLLPQPRPGLKTLGFCFADPFGLENLSFTTIRRLASRFMDFLVLIPTGMDASRNISHYLNPSNQIVERFLDLPTWRNEWHQAELKGENFGIYLTNAFGRQMAAMGYIYSGIDKTEQIRSTDKNLPLYRLAFFSRHKLGEKFWKESRKYSNDQLDLPW
jgi:three-Cys-motif partner protein